LGLFCSTTGTRFGNCRSVRSASRRRSSARVSKAGRKLWGNVLVLPPRQLRSSALAHLRSFCWGECGVRQARWPSARPTAARRASHPWRLVSESAAFCDSWQASMASSLGLPGRHVTVGVQCLASSGCASSTLQSRTQRRIRRRSTHANAHHNATKAPVALNSTQTGPR